MMNKTEIQKMTTSPDPDKVQAFAGLVISELSANMGGVMLQIGHELGLYKAMSDGQPYTAASLASKTGTYKRYIQEWLNSQAAGGYLEYEKETGTYSLSSEKAMVLAIEDSPAFLAPGFNVVQSMWTDKDRLRDAFKTGEGIPWHKHHHSLFFGTEAFYRSGYRANLVNNWIPKMGGMHEKLEAGGVVADVGCGHGASTLIMAEKYPTSTFHGFDYHRESILVAEERAKTKGIKNAFFHHKDAFSFDQEFDMICYMDAFHDFGDPLKSAQKAFECLRPDGSLLLVEPFAGDEVENNFNPIGRMFYSASTALCVPHSNSEKGQCCLGAQAGPKKIFSILQEAGFGRLSIVEQTPVNLIIEARK